MRPRYCTCQAKAIVTSPRKGFWRRQWTATICRWDASGLQSAAVQTVRPLLFPLTRLYTHVYGPWGLVRIPLWLVRMQYVDGSGDFYIDEFSLYRWDFARADTPGVTDFVLVDLPGIIVFCFWFRWAYLVARWRRFTILQIACTAAPLARHRFYLQNDGNQQQRQCTHASVRRTTINLVPAFHSALTPVDTRRQESITWTLLAGAPHQRQHLWWCHGDPWTGLSTSEAQLHCLRRLQRHRIGSVHIFDASVGGQGCGQTVRHPYQSRGPATLPRGETR